MPLVKPYLEKSFYDQFTAAAAVGQRGVIDRVIAVGADLENYYGWEEGEYIAGVPLLNLSLTLLAHEQECLMAARLAAVEENFRIASNAGIQVCDLNLEADLLEGVVEQVGCDLLVLCSLLYQPSDLRAMGSATRQSRHANKPEVWKAAFYNSGAKVIMNSWFPWDTGGPKISRLIESSQAYKKSDKGVFQFLDGDKSAEVFIRADLC